MRSTGYLAVLAIGHPAADKDGYVLEHRLVAEKMIGRYLEKSERVHHIDGVKTNNTPENLVVLRNQSEHVNLPGHGTDALHKWRRENPEAAKKSASDAGKLGAAAKWIKH